MAKQLDKVDVVIVGTGWAGGTVAAELSKKGYKVVALERGEDRDTQDFVGSKDELRYSRRYEMMQDLTNETITSRNFMDETALPVRDKADARGFGNATGGAGVHWNGINYRWQPYDFEIFSKTVERYGKDKIPKGMTLQDWGITYDELEPYYDKFEKTTGISGEENPIGPWRSDKLPNPPMKETPTISLYKEATKKLGYHPYQIASANMSQQYENPDGETINACMYCAFCEEYGCDFGAKSDPIVTVLKTANKTGNYEQRNQAYVTRVVHEGNRATGLFYIDLTTGEEFIQPADIVVLAGFTFTNNRLLMLSDIGEQYNPETRKGLIGKNFTGHNADLNYLGSTGFFNDKKFNNFMGAGALGASIDDFSADNLDHTDLDFLHGFEISYTMTGKRPIDNNQIPRGTPTWGREFKEKSLFYTNRHLSIFYQGGSLPWYHNYMDLDPTYKDAYGNPLVRVTKQYTDQDRALAQYAVDTSEKIMEEMGADIVEPDEFPDDMQFNHYYGSAHFGGGVLMGENPETSSVNNFSQMWEMDNLFVVGGSSFPHYSNYNPTLTIGALAYRASEGMIKYLEDGGGLLVQPKSASSAT